jgi:hypothetical protein
MGNLPSWEDQTRPFPPGTVAKTVAGNLVFWIIVGIGIWVWWIGRIDFPIDHVLEIKCDQDTGFDDNKLCLKPNRPGAELAFRVNERTQKGAYYDY